MATFHGPAGHGTLYVALYSPDLSKVRTSGTTFSTLPVLIAAWQVGLYTATEIVAVSGQGSGLYSFAPGGIAAGCYPFSAYLANTDTPNTPAEAEGYLDWSGSGQLNIAALSLAIARLTSVPIEYISPMRADGTFELVQGDDYYDADNHALEWTIADYSGPAISTVHLGLELASIYDSKSPTVSFTQAGTAEMVGDDLVIKVELSSTDTSALSSAPPADLYNYVAQLRFTTTSGHLITRELGAVTVKRKVF